MEKFIEGVRLQPCLWNPVHLEYRDVLLKDEAWKNVVEYYNNSSIPNIQRAKSEWKKLRDNHRDALKRAKLGKNKLLPAQITTWKYAKAMQFLEPHMKYRITECIEMDPVNNAASKNFEHDVSTTESPETTAGSQRTKRRCLEKSCVERIEFRQEKDALESFFNCMLKSTKSMPQWMQTQVKKKIFAVIIEAEENLSNQGHREANVKEPVETINPLEITVQNIKTEQFTGESVGDDSS